MKSIKDLLADRYYNGLFKNIILIFFILLMGSAIMVKSIDYVIYLNIFIMLFIVFHELETDKLQMKINYLIKMEDEFYGRTKTIKTNNSNSRNKKLKNGFGSSKERNTRSSD